MRTKGKISFYIRNKCILLTHTLYNSSVASQKSVFKSINKKYPRLNTELIIKLHFSKILFTACFFFFQKYHKCIKFKAAENIFPENIAP